MLGFVYAKFTATCAVQNRDVLDDHCNTVDILLVIKSIRRCLASIGVHTKVLACRNFLGLEARKLGIEKRKN